MRHLTIEQRESLETLLKTQAEYLREEIARALRRSGRPKPVNGAAANLGACSDVAVFQRSLNELRVVEQGLAHLRAPDYGICAACGAEIPYASLSANPAALRCVRCQVRFEHGWLQIAGHTL